MKRFAIMAFCSVVFGCTAAYAQDQKGNVNKGFPERAPAVYPPPIDHVHDFVSGDKCPCCGMVVDAAQAAKLNGEFPNGYYSSRFPGTPSKGMPCPCCGMSMGSKALAPHLPTPPTPNCQCGCTVTGNCVCKDCDHPALVSPKPCPVIVPTPAPCVQQTCQVSRRRLFGRRCR